MQLRALKATNDRLDVGGGGGRMLPKNPEVFSATRSLTRMVAQDRFTSVENDITVLAVQAGLGGLRMTTTAELVMLVFRGHNGGVG